VVVWKFGLSGRGRGSGTGAKLLKALDLL